MADGEDGEEQKVEPRPAGVHILTVMANHYVGNGLIPFKSLRSSDTSAGQLKVRAVFHARMLKKSQDVKGGYMPNQPMSVRANDDGTFTIFDGNHRYEAIQYLINHFGQNQPYSTETQIPCVIYSAALPSLVAMRFATLTNELQLCAAGSSSLDFLRFLLNLSTEQIAETGITNVSTVHTAFQSMFVQAQVDQPAWVTHRYTLRSFRYLSFFVGPPPLVNTPSSSEYGKGYNAFVEAEDLQDLDAPEIRVLFLAAARIFGVYIKKAEIDPLIDPETKTCVAFTARMRHTTPTCFLHPAATSFDTKGINHLALLEFKKTHPNIPKDVIPGVLYVHMLWAHWIITGGVPADKSRTQQICNDLLAHLNAWESNIVLENMKCRLEPVEEDDLPGGSAERYLEGLDPSVREALLAEVVVESVLSDKWAVVSKDIAERLKLNTKDVDHFGRHACRHSVEHITEKFKPIFGRPIAEVVWKDIRRCKDLMADLKDFIPRWREMAAGESVAFTEAEFKNAQRQKTAGGLLTFISALHLLQKIAPSGGVTAVVNDLDVLKKNLMDDWHMQWEATLAPGKTRTDLPSSIQAGLSFTGIDSTIARMKRDMIEATIEAERTTKMNNWKMAARTARTDQLRKLKDEAEASRTLERETAVLHEKKIHEDNENEAEVCALNVLREWNNLHSDLQQWGMPSARYNVLAIPVMKAKLFAVSDPEFEHQFGTVVDHLQKNIDTDPTFAAQLAVYKGVYKSRIYFIDIHKSRSTLDELTEELRDVIKHFSTTLSSLGDFKGKVSVLCLPDQQNAVYRALSINGFTFFDASPYTAGVGEDAFTLADKGGTNLHGDDDWDVHNSLLPHSGEVPYARSMDPVFLIISAGSEKHTPPEDRDILRAGTNFRRNFLPEIASPKWTSSHCSKYRFEFNISKHWANTVKYPREFALANFFFWHVREGDIITVRGSLRTALVARAVGHTVFYVATELKKVVAEKAFKDLALLAEPSIAAEFFRGYENFEHLLTVVQWCMETRKSTGLDAYALLLQQPRTMEERFVRREDFWSEAFKAMKCRPFIVAHPTRCVLYFCRSVGKGIKADLPAWFVVITTQ